MMEPRYRDVKKIQIPLYTTESGVKIRIICGEVYGIRGPVQDIITDPRYLDITVPAGTQFNLPTTTGHTVFAYVIDGKGCFCQNKDLFNYPVEGENYYDTQRDPYITNGNLVLFDDGEQVIVSTEDVEMRFLLISGKPIGEPVAWYGPIVMNTQAELQTAFEEYNNGTFIKHKKQ
jgi:quercetin 2,3-dioxygenase